jgi:hypothetical protein
MQSWTISTKSLITSTRSGTRRWRLITAICLLSLMLTSSSCVRVKPFYFNDSDRVYSGNAGETVKPDFDWVLMSKGNYRKLTTINPDR